MKILLDEIQWAYPRLDSVILHAGLYEQDRCRLIEVRDGLAEAVAQVLGPGDAQEFLQKGVQAFRLDPRDAHVGMPRSREDAL